MVPPRFNSRFTVAAGNGTAGRNRPMTFDELDPAASLNGDTSSPEVCTFDLDFCVGRMTRHTIPDRTSSYPGGKGHTHTGADTPRFSRACCYLAALSSDLLAGALRGEVMLAGLVADKRVAAHTLKGRKETGRDACGCVCG